MGIEKTYYETEEAPAGIRTPPWTAAEANELRQRMKEIGLYPSVSPRTPAIPCKCQVDTILDELTAAEIQMLRDELAERKAIAQWQQVFLQ